MTQVCYPVHK